MKNGMKLALFSLFVILFVASASAYTCIEAKQHGLFSTSISGPTAKVTNNADSAYNFTFAHYKMYDNSIDNQTLFDVKTILIPAHSSANITINLPNCKYQQDLSCDQLPVFTGGPFYGAEIIRWNYGGSVFCSKDIINCTTDAQCNDNKPLTFDQCINPNTVSSYCRNTPINCAQNSDCGTTGFLGNSYCSGNNLFRNFQTSICHNPGTLTSYCTKDVTSNLTQTCAYGCSNNQCNSCPIINPINITLISPAQNQRFPFANNIPLNFTVQGNVSSCWYKLDNSSQIALPNCKNTKFSASEGQHSLTLYSNNTDNNVSSVTHQFTVDLSGPQVNLSYPLNVTLNISSVTFNYSASDIDGVSTCTLWLTNSHNLQFSARSSFSQTLSNGNYTWNVLCSDSYGNSAFSPKNGTFSIALSTNPTHTSTDYNITTTHKKSTKLYAEMYAGNSTVYIAPQASNITNSTKVILSAKEEPKSFITLPFLLIIAIILVLILIILIILFR